MNIQRYELYMKEELPNISSTLIRNDLQKYKNYLCPDVLRYVTYYNLY